MEEAPAIQEKYNKAIIAWGRKVAGEIPAMAYALGIKDWSFQTNEENYKSIFEAGAARSRAKKDNYGDVFNIGTGIPYQAFLSSVLGVGRNHPFSGTAAARTLLTGGGRIKDPIAPVIEANIEDLADTVGENRADLNTALINDRLGPQTQNFGNG
jgi:hypothetical protein